MTDSIFIAEGEHACGHDSHDGHGSHDSHESHDSHDGERRGGQTSSSHDAAGIAMVIRPTEHASGPWDPRALHGGAPAALIAAAFERVEPGSQLRIARLGFELLRPIPLAPLTLTTRIVRPGRRVQELAAELSADLGDGPQLVCRASALRVQEVSPDVAAAAARSPDPAARRSPEQRQTPHRRIGCPRPSRASRYASRSTTPSATSFAASAMEMRWLDDPRAARPGARVDAPAPSAADRPTADAAGAAGRDRRLRQRRQRRAAVRALPVHQRRPHDRTCSARRAASGSGSTRARCCTAAAAGLAESILHDVHGPVGRAFQTLVVQPR